MWIQREAGTPLPEPIQGNIVDSLTQVGVDPTTNAASLRITKEINDNLTSFHYRVNQGTRQISDDGVNWENFNSGAELLWSNPAPTSDFSAQTVNIDLTNYKAIILVTKDDKNNDYKPRGATYLVKFNNQQIGISVTGGFTRVVRQVSKIDDNGVTIGACQGVDANNRYIIPLYIFGLKSDIGLSDYINGTNGL